MNKALTAIGACMNGDHPTFILMSAFSIIIFRSELCLLLGLMLLPELIHRRLGILSLLLWGAVGAITGLGMTVLVDSFFWQRWLWPEGEVLWYNTILNKSIDWGTSPFFWYFYSALPRALGTSLLLIPLGLIVDRKLRSFLLPPLGFMLLYSILPHKELRFIIYVFPMFNVASACAVMYIFKKFSKSFVWKILSLGAIAHFVANVFITSAFLLVSFHNYPGGNALQNIHQLISPDRTDVYIHIDVETAQTGASRFGQLHDSWRYNKTEGLTPGSEDMQYFTHICVAANSANDPTISIYKEARSHAILTFSEGYQGIDLEPWEVPRLRIEPRIFILQNKDWQKKF
ncbi:putative dol-P-Man:Man(7)GlcNAc(2)-PP-Dol alpha-1,6-mannosyltransferase [Apostichopus japonicus]|uniref:Mannosyltransferase n=1 Tax=Stichopus japonicus TaxID=307972 RepID=A0A2G8L076_STIJA|nr:putative dol-P-Man:Man(7)GlcNAc(2)-PP-Dol alpha-1,6-mannosyltransferase [Apostichopus japonicus]